MARTFLFVVMLLTASVYALDNSDPVIERIVGMAIEQQGASVYLQELTDSVGGRMTGTPQNSAAAQLILSTLRNTGFDNAHFEEFKLESVWHRGPASAYVVGPVKRPLVVSS